MRVLIIPAAGNGSRFKAEGYDVPKPLITLPSGEMMVTGAMRPLVAYADEVIILLSDELSQEQAKELRDNIYQQLPTEQAEKTRGFFVVHQPLGAAMTVLAVQGGFPDDTEVVVINSDQVFSYDVVDRWFAHIETHRPDGSLLTFQVPDQNDARWSFVTTTEKAGLERLVHLVEKVHVSDTATCGAYYFKTWSSLRKAICQMVAADDRTNGEFYLAPTYNYMAEGTVTVVDATGQFASLGTPELLRAWEAAHAEQKAD